MKLFELTKALITLESPTGKEQNVSEFLSSYLRGAGFNVETQEVGEGRFNVYAYVGNPIVVLSTHTDTVSPYLFYSENNDLIFGRGACDAKGIAAAQIKAAEKLLESSIKNFGLLFVVGEEGGSDGARAANIIKNKCRFLINGEPTENKLAVASKGALRIEVETFGRAAHSAYPKYGESAIIKLLDVLNDLRSLDLPKHDILDETNFNIGVISGGILSNVIPDQARAELMFRTVSDTIEIKNLIEKVIRDRAKLKYTFECNPVFLETIYGIETTVAAFTTDIPFLTNWGKPFLIGPGSILNAHSTEECIEKKELVRAVDIYCKIIQKLLRI